VAWPASAATTQASGRSLESAPQEQEDEEMTKLPYDRVPLRQIVAACALTAALALSLAPAFAGTRVDLNTATVEQLQELPGIGPSKAEAIIEERKNGRFSSVDDLERVKGIGPSTMVQLKEHVTVSAEAAK
jgi:competence protein ComEA